MPRVCLIQVPIRRPSDHPVEEPGLLEVAGTTTQPAFDLAQEARLHLVLDPVEVLVPAGEREVVPVDHALHVPLRVIEAAGAGLATSEAKPLQS
eukprot:3092536-Prorocentrum_lima.AAC.1